MNPAAGDLFAGGLVVSFVGAAGAWAVALLAGAAVMPSRLDEGVTPSMRLVGWAVVGMAVQTQAWLLLSVLGAISPRSVVAGSVVLAVAGAGVAGRKVVRAFSELRMLPARDGRAWEAILVGTGVVFLLAVGRLALWPTVFYDDLVYHVAAPRQALLTGVWPADPGMHYAFMPAGWDAAYLLPLALGGGVGPQMMNVVALALLWVATVQLAARFSGRAAALAAGLLLLATPMSVSLGAFAGNDLFVGVALAAALDRLVATEGRRPVAVGLLAGAAWAAKMTALPAAAGIALAAAVYRASAWVRLSRAAIVGLVTLAVAFAWTLRSFLLTGNPLYPAFFGLFGGKYWNEQSAEIVATTVSHGGLEESGVKVFVTALLDLLFRSGELGFPSGTNAALVVLGLVGCLLALRVRAVLPLFVVGGVAYVGWCITSLNLRYGLILLVLLAVFAAFVVKFVLGSLRSLGRGGLAWALALVVVLVAAGPAVSGVRRHMAYYGSGTAFFPDTPRRDMQVTRLNLAAAGRWMADELPADARILLVAEGRVGLLPRPARASSAYDHPDIATLVAGARSVEEVNGRVAEFSHVVINERELQRQEELFGFVDRFGDGEWELFRQWLVEGLTPVAKIGNVIVFEVPRD